MTYTGCIIIVAIIWACIRFIIDFNRCRKIKKTFPNSRAHINASSGVWIKPFLVIVIAVIIWAFSLLTLGLIGWNIPVETYIRTPVHSNNEMVVFEQQQGDEFVVSISNKEYICTELVISDKVTSVQVVLVECKTADNFFAKFFFDELTGFGRYYELHIPTSFLCSN